MLIIKIENTATRASHKKWIVIKIRRSVGANSKKHFAFSQGRVSHASIHGPRSESPQIPQSLRSLESKKKIIMNPV